MELKQFATEAVQRSLIRFQRAHRLAYFKPGSGMNKSATALYDKNVLQITRQVKYTGGKAWVMSVPEEMKGRVFSTPKPYSHKYLITPMASGAISSELVSVVPRNDNREKIDIPARVSPSVGLRIKIGKYEFEADENFPADKLAELLRGLAADGK